MFARLIHRNAEEARGCRMCQAARRMWLYGALPAVAWFVIVFGLLWFVTGEMPNVAKGAPAPKKKAAPTRPDLKGWWQLTWNGTTAPCELREKGVWWCYWNRQEWMGTWTLKDDTLTVSETPNLTDPDPSYFTWTVKLLPGKWQSVAGNSPTFTLGPFKAKKFD